FAVITSVLRPIRIRPAASVIPCTTLFRSHLDDLVLAVARLLVQPVDVLGDDGDQAPGAFQVDEGAVAGVGTRGPGLVPQPALPGDRKSTRLNSSHVKRSDAVFRLNNKTHP